MGLDLVVEGRPKLGAEADWRAILERSFNGTPIEGDEIIIPPYEELGAPRVGFDRKADEWIVKASGADTPEKIAKVLSDAYGY
nr:hypothetical protein [uncultured Sphingomonas sp.]